ncbi:hypothetical protein TNCV_1861891 [Trichonephila clavipes]|nr:hypothetical protein TNCV_1861891 [Trichonephila clavipes]
MECFTNTELADMLLISGLAEGNVQLTERSYRERFSESGRRVTPTPNMVLGFLTMVSNTFCSMHGTICVGYQSIHGTKCIGYLSIHGTKCVGYCRQM